MSFPVLADLYRIRPTQTVTRKLDGQLPFVSPRLYPTRGHLPNISPRSWYGPANNFGRAVSVSRDFFCLVSELICSWYHPIFSRTPRPTCLTHHCISSFLFPYSIHCQSTATVAPVSLALRRLACRFHRGPLLSFPLCGRWCGSPHHRALVLHTRSMRSTASRTIPLPRRLRGYKEGRGAGGFTFPFS